MSALSTVNVPTMVAPVALNDAGRAAIDAATLAVVANVLVSGIKFCTAVS